MLVEKYRMHDNSTVLYKRTRDFFTGGLKHLPVFEFEGLSGIPFQNISKPQIRSLSLHRALFKLRHRKGYCFVHDMGAWIKCVHRKARLCIPVDIFRSLEMIGIRTKTTFKTFLENSP